MKRSRMSIRAGCLALLVLGLGRFAYADAGVPMLAAVWPASWVLLIPIIVVEGWVARKLVGLTFKQGLMASAAANAFSTFVGLPLTWGLLAGVEIVATRGGHAYGIRTVWGKILTVTLQAPWLMPYESDLDWMIPAAAIVLLFPFFFMSVFTERWLFLKISRCSKELASRWSWVANGVTYSLILIGLAALLVSR